MQRLLQEIEAATHDSADLARCITETDTEYGYWWRYEPAHHHPNDAMIGLIHIARVVADAEARHTGKTYHVASTPQPKLALYVFACDHPDASDAAINIMYDCPPTGTATRRRAPVRV